MDNINRPNLNKGISVDCVVFGFDFKKLKVLLIQRKSTQNVEMDHFSLPGDLIYDNENLDQAAIRVLKELTGLENIFLEQLKAFSDLTRLSNEDDITWLREVRDQPEALITWRFSRRLTQD